jgi:hypothetical protein
VDPRFEENLFNPVVKTLHDTVNTSPSGCEASQSIVLPCASPQSFIHSVYMHTFSDKYAIALATHRCFGLVDRVQTGMERKRRVCKSKMKFTLEQAMTAQCRSRDIALLFLKTQR